MTTLDEAIIIIGDFVLTTPVNRVLSVIGRVGGNSGPVVGGVVLAGSNDMDQVKFQSYNFYYCIFYYNCIEFYPSFLCGVPS